MFKDFTEPGGCADSCCPEQKKVKKLRKKLCESGEAAVATSQCGSGKWIDICCPSCGGRMTGLCRSFSRNGMTCPQEDDSGDDSGETSDVNTCSMDKSCFASCPNKPTTCSMFKDFTEPGGCADSCCPEQKKIKKLRKKLCESASVLSWSVATQDSYHIFVYSLSAIGLLSTVYMCGQFFKKDKDSAYQPVL